MAKPTRDNLTTFIIPSIRRDTLQRAIDSVPQGTDFMVGFDDDRRGEGVVRNELISKAVTPWVSFLDDDDTVTSDYVERLYEEIGKNPDADIIHFRQYFLRGLIMPGWPTVEWGNIGIAYSVKREVALEYPEKSEKHEDYEHVKRMVEAGKKIVFSPYITYRVRH